MRKHGFTILEMLVAVGLVGIIMSIAVVAYVGYQRSSQTVDALATVSVMRERLAVARSMNSEQLLVCDNSLTEPGDLDDVYMDLEVTALPLDETDPSAGYGGGISVSARVDQHGTGGVQAARQLHDELQGQQADIRGSTLTDSVVTFSVLVTSPNEAHCLPPAIAASGSGSQPSATPAAQSGQSQPAPLAAEPPSLSFSFTTSQQVVEFADTGTGSVMNTGPLKTGGPVRDLAVEFNVMGGQQVATSGIHGATFLSYGANGNENEFYVWKPDDMTIRIAGSEYATGIDTTDGQSHRYSVLWSSDTGTLTVLVDGVVRFQRDNIAQGYEIPGDGVLALAQDQDRYAIEDGSGADHGFNPGDSFHGQYFSAALASARVDPASLADRPLSSVVDASSGLVTDIRMQGGGAVDLTGKHQLMTVGDVTSRTVEVDTSIATPNPGATLNLSVSVQPKGSDQLTGLEISGLLPGSTLKDGSGNSGTGPRHDILGWDYQSLTAELPAGIAENMRIRVVATVTGVNGDDAMAEAERVLILDPGKSVPAAASAKAP